MSAGSVVVRVIVEGAAISVVVEVYSETIVRVCVSVIAESQYQQVCTYTDIRIGGNLTWDGRRLSFMLGRLFN